MTTINCLYKPNTYIYILTCIYIYVYIYDLYESLQMKVRDPKMAENLE